MPLQKIENEHLYYKMCARHGHGRIGTRAEFRGGRVGALVCRRVGASACWCVGALLCRHVGVSAQSRVSVLACQHVGVSARWRVGVSAAHWCVGTLMRWCVRWCVGMVTRWRAAVGAFASAR